MSTSGETADLMVKEGIQITESAVKLAGLGAKNLAALLIALANDNQKLAGKTNLKRLIHDGEALTIFSVKKEDLAGFHGEAKRYGVLYCPIVNKVENTGMVEIMAKARDAKQINRIFERMGYPAPAQEDASAKKAKARDPSDNSSRERRTVVEKACSLVGKVNYFWGGKSLTLGWDSQWGQLRKVAAKGSPSTGTYRPYGLDCSGFVDWVFYNATDGAYVIGHGGGARMQHAYCTEISWNEAQPGDLVFYPDDTHVGIVGGWDTNGNLLVIHCSTGANNVVITGTAGFTDVARPEI